MTTRPVPDLLAEISDEWATLGEENQGLIVQRDALTFKVAVLQNMNDNQARMIRKLNQTIADLRCQVAGDDADPSENVESLRASRERLRQVAAGCRDYQMGLRQGRRRLLKAISGLRPGDLDAPHGEEQSA